MEVKGIVHCHSTYSYDAKLSLAELKVLFQKKGIQFVCMTEHVDELTHERAQTFVEECEKLSDETFCFVPGFEVPYKHAHVLMIGTRDFLGNYAPTIESLTEWTDRASFVVLAHPVRNNFLVDEGLLRQIDALEVWNQQYEGKRVPRTHSLTLLESLRVRKPGLLAIGGIDLHRSEHMGAPLVSLNVTSLTEAMIVEKLKNGAYVVSSERSTFFGTLPNSVELIQKHRWESAFSVTIIMLGKFVNRVLASFGFSLPKSYER